MTDTLIFANAIMIRSIITHNGGGWSASEGSDFGIAHNFNQLNGKYEIVLYNYALNEYGFIQDGFFGSWIAITESYLPMPAEWILNEDGINLNEADWSQGEPWVDFANYLHILPYWHYAE